MTYNFSDKTVSYFFHNIYGDADELLASKPENVINIPFGWTEPVEENRQHVLHNLDATVSGLPSLAFWVEEYQFERFDEVYKENVTETIPAHWEVLDIDRGIEKPWTWTKVQAKIDNWKLDQSRHINA